MQRLMGVSLRISLTGGTGSRAHQNITPSYTELLMPPDTTSTFRPAWDRHGSSLPYQQIKLLLNSWGKYNSVVVILVCDISEAEVKAVQSAGV